MADFNKVLDPGDYKNAEVNVVVEIPAGSNHKIEWDRERACFMLDRIEPRTFAKPCNYGFIPQTIDDDGDELDVLLITDQPLPTGIWTRAHILGVMKFIDDGEIDDKIICVPADDRHNGNARHSIEDLPDQTIKQIQFYFSHYKDLKDPDSTEVVSFEGLESAQKSIEEAIQRFQDAHREETTGD